MNTERVTRVEVIDHEGRSAVHYGVAVRGIAIQDDGKTLKIFLVPHPTESEDKVRTALRTGLADFFKTVGKET